MSGLRVQVDGLDRLAAKLQQVPAAMIAGAEQAVEETTEAVAELMREMAPVDTGELRDSVEAESSGLSGVARATARHSVHVEHGTSSMPEQPFALPAAEQGRAILPERIAERIRGELP